MRFEVAASHAAGVDKTRLRAMNRELKVVGFLSVGKARESDSGATVGHLQSDRGFGLGTSLAEDSESGQSFVVNLSNQKGFAAFVSLPHLSDLNLASGHVYECSHIPGLRQYARTWRIPRGNSRQRDSRLAPQAHPVSLEPRGNYLGTCAIKRNEQRRPALGVYNSGRVLRRYP